jgi:DNA-directed RNA polymerase subunit M/transcription elongation factor TFIIS
MEMLHQMFADMNQSHLHHIKWIYEYRLPKDTTLQPLIMNPKITLHGSKKQAKIIQFIEQLVPKLISFIFGLQVNNEPLSQDILDEIEVHLDKYVTALKVYYKKYDNEEDLIWHQDIFLEAQESVKMEIIRAKYKPLGITDYGHCPQCNSKNLHVVEKQTRSSDEPSTLFITCLYCNFNWRRSG